MITPVQTGHEGQWVNSPDLRTFDLLALKQTLAVQTAKRSKYSRLLSLHVDSMFSCDRGFKTVKCAFYHTSKPSCNLTQPIPLLKTRRKKKITSWSPKFGRKRHPSAGRDWPRGKGQSDTDKITVNKRSVGWTQERTGRCAPKEARWHTVGMGWAEDARVTRSDYSDWMVGAIIFTHESRFRVTLRSASDGRWDGRRSAGTWGHLELRG